VNEVPNIILPVDQVNDLVMVSDPTSITVITRDPEGDVVHFEWDVPPEFLVEQTDYTVEDDVYASTARVERDPRLEGFRLRCVVTDYISSPSQQVVWDVTVQE